MEESENFLSKIFDLLLIGDAFVSDNDEPKSVIDFVPPEELKKIAKISLCENIEPMKDHEQVDELLKNVIKFSVKTGNRNFHNQLYGATDFYGLGAEWICSALNTVNMTFEIAPVFALIEEEVIQRCLELFGYQNGDGIFCPGGSTANFYGIHMARCIKFPSSRNEGSPSGLVMFTSEDAHYSLKKGANFLGIGMNNLIAVKTNVFGQMIPEDLEEKIQEAIKKNLKPFFVNTTCGTTVLGAFDDINAIADVCEKYNLWFHADACQGGSAIFSQKHRHLLDGIHRAHSIAWDAHKTLGAPLQCTVFLVNQKGLLSDCNSSSAQYLFQQDKYYDTSFDTGDKSIQCGRKVDAFKLWFMWKKRGLTGFEKLIDNAFDRAEYLLHQIEKHQSFELVIPKIQYTNVSFFYIPKFMQKKQRDEEWWQQIYKIQTAIKEKMVMNGNLMISYSPLAHKNIGNFFRMVVTCHPKATNESMHFVIEQIEKIGEEIQRF